MSPDELNYRIDNHDRFTLVSQLPAHPRANTLTRRGRVMRRSKTSLAEEEQEGEQEEQAKGGNKKRAADVLKERQVRRTAIKTIPPCYMLPRFRWASRR